MYQGEKFVDFGIRVQEEKCFQRLVKVLDMVKQAHNAELESDLVVKPTVSLISEVLIMDRLVNRRAFAIESLGGLTAGFGNTPQQQR